MREREREREREIERERLKVALKWTSLKLDKFNNENPHTKFASLKCTHEHKWASFENFQGVFGSLECHDSSPPLISLSFTQPQKEIWCNNNYTVVVA